MKYSYYLLILFLSISINLNAQNYKWAKGMGGIEQDNGLAIALDKHDNVYTTGSFRNVADFDPSNSVFSKTAQGLSDVFVSKLDSNGNFIWAQSFGGTSFCSANSITVDSNSNVIVTGAFQGSADFDPDTTLLYVTSSGGREIFITKLDSNGHLVWSKFIGGFTDDEAYSVCSDNNGNIYVTGNFSSTVDFDPGVGIYNLNGGIYGKIFILKLNSNGDFVFAKELGGASGGAGSSIVVDKSNNIYTAGSFWGTGDFNPDPLVVLNFTAMGINDAFISKLDSNGNFKKAFQISGTNDERIYSIDIDTNQNMYTTGLFQGTTDFNPGLGTNSLTSNGYQDEFICKLDSAGNFVWAKKIGGTGPDRGSHLKVDNLGNVLTTGYFYYSVDFNPNAGIYNMTSPNMSDAYISKLDSNGNFVFAKQIGGPQFGGGGDQQGLGLALNKTGSVYSVGLFQNASDFNPGIDTSILYSHGGNDIYVLKLTPCSDTSYYSYIACDSIIINGNTYHVSGNYTFYSESISGCDSITILNLSISNSTSDTITLNACDSLIFGGLTYTSSGIYNHQYISSTGCDSLIFLDLTINHSSSSVIDTTACDVFQLNSQVYNSSGTYSQTLLNSEGCDSVLLINLTINNSTNNTMNPVACKSYILNGQTYSISGIYTQQFSNTVGCDSILTINLTINNVDTSITQLGSVLTSNSNTANYQWIDCDGNTIILGATSQSFTPTKNGNFALIITENGCTDTSSCYSITSMSSNDISNSKLFEIFPNPNQGNFWLHAYETYSNVDIQLNDITGKLISDMHFDQLNNIQINIEGRTGIYLLHIHTTKAAYIIKIFKE